jgi:hypothetical protein
MLASAPWLLSRARLPCISSHLVGGCSRATDICGSGSLQTGHGSNAVWGEDGGEEGIRSNALDDRNKLVFESMENSGVVVGGTW